MCNTTKCSIQNFS